MTVPTPISPPGILGATVVNVTNVSPSPVRETSFGTSEQVHQKIIDAAMKCFAEIGSQAASLRLVAKTAGFSVGLVQHHFRTKALLVDAVNQELAEIIRNVSPVTSPLADPVADTSHRITTLIAEQPVAVNYLARVLIDNEPAGREIFDLCFDVGKAQWDDVYGAAPLPGVNATWGVLNPLILIMGTLVLRPHIERQLPEPLASPAQLPIWEHALTHLIAAGRLPHLPAADDPRE